jgi:LPS export ABC transporter protein LptC
LKKLLPLTLLLLAACGAKDQHEALPGVSLLEDFSIAENSEGTSRWSLEAKKGRLDEKGGSITFTSPHIRFYDADKLSSEITARAGSLKMLEKSAVLNDDVEVNALRDGMRLSTTKLYYSSARGKIWTEEPVTIHKERTVIKGRGFTANPDLSEIEIRYQETRLSGK